MDLRVCPNPNANLSVTRVFCSVKDGTISTKNSPKRTSHGVARAIVKGTSMRSPSPITAPACKYVTNVSPREYVQRRS